MPQSLAQVWLHVIFSTKNRCTFLQEKAFREEMFRMLAHYVSDCGCISASVGGWVDHVHLLVGISRTTTIAKLVETLKIETSKWAKDAKNGSGSFAWQSGYGAFSVSHSNASRVDQYIRDQATHHQKLTFQEEYRRICQKHGLEIDERYVWD